MTKDRSYRTKADERFGVEDDKKREKERVETEQRQTKKAYRKQSEPAWAVGHEGSRFHWAYWKVLSNEVTQIGSSLTLREAEHEVSKLHGTLPNNKLDDQAALRVHANKKNN